ncbi:MAG: MarR family winged helix-turn-helix transcriptional regulator [Devosia sp.]
MISDDIQRATSSRAPEAGPTASALAVLAHRPGLTVRMLAAGVGLSHAGAVRLVDRLALEGLIERREDASDGRAKAIYLTAAGTALSDDVLASRDGVIAEGLLVLNEEEVEFLAKISERVLRARLRNLEHSVWVCRLCRYGACSHCPIDAELRLREVDEE